MTAVLILVSQHQLRWVFVFAVVYFAPIFIRIAADVPGMRLYTGLIEVISLLLVCFLGWGLALLDKRIADGLVRREADARASEKALIQERIQFAIDAHDTVSHSLAKESAILRIARRSSGGSVETGELIDQAIETNHEAQLDLRHLLAKLNESGTETVSDFDVVDLSREIDLEIREIRKSFSELGPRFDVTADVVHYELARGLAETVLLMLRELVTNVAKHADLSKPVSITVVMHHKGVLQMRSQNAAELHGEFAPRTLSTRSATLGGRCLVTRDQGEVTVLIELPLGESIAGEVAGGVR